MVQPVIATLPYINKEEGNYNAWKIRYILKNWDIKDWIVALETGKGGYRHYQIRFDLSGDFDIFFAWCNHNIRDMHIEKASAGTYSTDYERKDGFFICSRDNRDILRVRFAPLTQNQREILWTARSQNDRQIDVWLDKKGGHGKSFITVQLWERGKALVVPRSATTPEKLSAFVCSAYKGEEFIIIDIPRATKIPPAIYECIEEVKDGLVFDHRYSGRTRNVRGAKIIIFTNTPMDTKKLSADRWRLHGLTGMPLS